MMLRVSKRFAVMIIPQFSSPPMPRNFVLGGFWLATFQDLGLHGSVYFVDYITCTRWTGCGHRSLTCICTAVWLLITLIFNADSSPRYFTSRMPKASYTPPVSTGHVHGPWTRASKVTPVFTAVLDTLVTNAARKHGCRVIFDTRVHWRCPYGPCTRLACMYRAKSSVHANCVHGPWTGVDNSVRSVMSVELRYLKKNKIPAAETDEVDSRLLMTTADECSPVDSATLYTSDARR